MRYIDIHCHLDFPDYSTELAEVLKRMKVYDISAITIGTDLESSKRAVKIAEENENIWACIGIHPVEKDKSFHETSPFDEKEFEKLVTSPKMVAIGECGLDYFARHSLGGVGLSEEDKKKQKKLFESQIQFALKHDKPLMLHCRDSYDDILDILKSYKKSSLADGEEKLRGNVHFFAGNMEQAKSFLDLGFSMSFTGVITFTHDYDEVIKYLPIDSIMSETDAPFVAPMPYRGKRNEPSYVIEVVKKMAEIRGESFDALSASIIKNAQRLFGMMG